jgi:hypothetical protein
MKKHHYLLAALVLVALLIFVLYENTLAIP